MANPRQRRKLRSGTHKPVQHSRRAKTLLKKQPPIRGPKVLQDAWDGHKTVRQNYEALGLAASLNPIASGGVERKVVRAVHGQGGEEVGEGSSSRGAGAEGRTGANGVRKGFGKIVRDSEGNVVDVQLGEDESDEEGGEEKMTAERVDEDLGLSGDDQLAGWIGLGSAGGPATDAGQGVVQALEQLSEAGGGRVRRFTSQGELETLRRLVGRHGEDVEAMARDRRLNADQRTAGELRRAIRKAGGLGRLRPEGRRVRAREGA